MAIIRTIHFFILFILAMLSFLPFLLLRLLAELIRDRPRPSNHEVWKHCKKHGYWDARQHGLECPECR